MAVINVALSDTFDEWRQKTNDIGSTLGDIATLDPVLGVSDIVSAINTSITSSAIYSPLNIVNGGEITTDDSQFTLTVNSQTQATLDSNGDLTASRDLIATRNVSGVDITATDQLAGDSLGVTNNATVGGTLGVTGLTTLTSVTASGDITLGDSSADTLDLNAKIEGDLLTTTDSTYAIGTSSVRWSTAWVDSVNASTSITSSGSLAVTGNAAIDGTLSVDGNTTIGDNSGDSHTVNGSVTHNNWIRPNGDNTLTIGSSSLRYNNIHAVNFTGTATAAQYADLAELYLADKEYPIGTVMRVGGEKEVTRSVSGCRAIGVVSEFPAYLMNKDLEGGTAIALKGRVPVQVVGPIAKGDQLIPTSDGLAIAGEGATVFAVALEDKSGADIGKVEAVVL